MLKPETDVNKSIKYREKVYLQYKPLMIDTNNLYKAKAL